LTFQIERIINLIGEGGREVASPIRGWGKSELQRAGCHLTGGRGNATDRATETRQPMARTGSG